MPGIFMLASPGMCSDSPAPSITIYKSTRREGNSYASDALDVDVRWGVSDRSTRKYSEV
jgi:hypothetical protein